MRLYSIIRLFILVIVFTNISACEINENTGNNDKRNLKKINHTKNEESHLLKKASKSIKKPIKISYTNTPDITDIEGNTYKTIRIGNQRWMTENLKTKTFSNGDEVDEIYYTNGNWEKDNKKWNNTIFTPQLLIYDDQFYYNGEVVIDNRNVCPTGWHIPTDKEWSSLMEALGGIEVAGKSMKSKDFWNGTNKSGFDARAVGHRNLGGMVEVGESCDFWSNTETSEHIEFKGRDHHPELWIYGLRGLYNYDINVWRHGGPKSLAYSIRCIEN